MNIYIGGDSFCHHRADIEKHWPAIVASKLNKPLYGEGFTGMGFWSLRQNLLKYKDSEHFNKTDLFVFCHSEPSRVLHPSTAISPNHVNTSSFLSKKEKDNVAEVYYKYIYDEQVYRWAYTMWLTELNSLVVGKKVIHLPCFQASKELVNDISLGAKLDIPLMDIGIMEVLHSQGKSYRQWYSNREPFPAEWLSLPANHLNDKSNNQLAQYVIDVYNDMNENTNKTYHILLDQH